MSYALQSPGKVEIALSLSLDVVKIIAEASKRKFKPHSQSRPTDKPRPKLRFKVGPTP